MSESHTVVVEARSYELDPYGHVNNAVFVNWLEHGRLSWLRERGLTWTSIPDEYGVRVVIVHIDIDYRAEVRLGDEVRVTSRVERIGTSSFTFRQDLAFPDGREVATATAVMVCTGQNHRSTPLPEGLRSRLEGAGPAPGG